ncbi:LytTR family DNA-binding domain-containing protein [Thiohalorhabdus sp. Cl-TMA]|uniref:LytTR family DNA-binding domain-containing protein n=1 Tax=Thiohalorhabdus methylotrophus TaxID=3242694 RepID=A0ABV4U0I5_9GAMM
MTEPTSRNTAGWTEPESDPAALREQIPGLLSSSHMLVALLDEAGKLLFTNPALRAQIRQAPETVATFPDLFTAWSRDKVLESGLPMAREQGLWEGGLTLCRSHRSPAVHAILVGPPSPDEGDTILALLVPHFGIVANGSDIGTDMPDFSARLAVPLYHETRFLDPEEIGYLEAHGSYTQIFLSGQTLLTSLSLSSFGQALPDSFMRVHRSFVVNLQRVHALVRRDGHLFLKLDDSAAHEVPVSRRRERQLRLVLDTARQVNNAAR